jgi:hypothetical protein
MQSASEGAPGRLQRHIPTACQHAPACCGHHAALPLSTPLQEDISQLLDGIWSLQYAAAGPICGSAGPLPPALSRFGGGGAAPSGDTPAGAAFTHAVLFRYSNEAALRRFEAQPRVQLMLGGSGAPPGTGEWEAPPPEDCNPPARGCCAVRAQRCCILRPCPCLSLCLPMPCWRLSEACPHPISLVGASVFCGLTPIQTT